MPFSLRLRAALVALLLAPSSALAQPADERAPSVVSVGEPPLRMTWESDDPACRGDGVSARALRLVSPGVVPRPLRASVEVRHDGAEWLVRLQTESGELSGRRTLRAESCSELEQAIALLLAMAMESKGDVLPPEPARPAPAESETPPAPAPPPPVVVPAPATPAEVGGDRPKQEGADSSERSSLGWFVRLDGKAAYGLKPGLGLGVGIAAGIRLGDFDIGASAAHWPTSRAEASGRPGYINLSRQDIGLRACWSAWRAGGFTLAPCIAPELTFFRWESRDVLDPRQGTEGPLTSVTAGVDLRYSVVADRVSILLTPALTLGRVQPFHLGLWPNNIPANQPLDNPPDPVEIYRTERFAPRLELGVDARF